MIDIWRKFTLIFISKLSSKNPIFKRFENKRFSCGFPVGVMILVLRHMLPLFFIISCVPPIKPELYVSSEDRKQKAGLPKNKV